MYRNKTNVEKKKAKNSMGDLVTTSKNCKTFSKRDSTVWRDELCTITKIIDDTIPLYFLELFS